MKSARRAYFGVSGGYIKSAMNNRYLNINTRLAEEVLRQGLADEFRVLLALKCVADGNGAYFEVTPDLKDSLRGLCGWKTRRTAERKIRRLFELGWLGTDGDRLYVRSFSYLLNQVGVESSTVHQIGVPFCVESKRKMKAVLFSVSVGKIIANRQFALVRKNATHTSTGSARHFYKPGHGETHSPNDLSVSFLAGRFDRSKATIHRWKHAAMEEGLLEREKRKFEFPGIQQTDPIQSAFPEDAYRTYLSLDRGCVVVQLTDRLDVGLKYKSRKQ